MSLLTIVQSVCERTQLPSPDTVMGSTDMQVVQMRALLEDEGKLLARRGDWQQLTREVTHTTLATEDQGAMATIAGDDFRAVNNETMWDRTDKLPVPLIGSVAWQRIKATTGASPRFRYRIRTGNLLLTPTPPAGHTLAFEYQSKYWVLSSNGVTRQTTFSRDADTCLLDEDILALGLRWRWKKEHGLEYAEDFRDYEAMVTDALGRDGGKPIINMDGAAPDVRPGIIVQPYSWPL